jgi:hypothetical protein
MIEPWSFVIVALAAFRLTRFFTLDSLVGANLDSNSAFSRVLDEWAYDEEGNERGFIRGKVGDLLSCPYCLGFWISLACWWLWTQDFEFVREGLTVFAVAGAQSMCSKWDRG